MATSRSTPETKQALSESIQNLKPATLLKLEKVRGLFNYFEKKDNDCKQLQELFPECKDDIDTLLRLENNNSSPQFIAAIVSMITTINNSVGTQLTNNLKWQFKKNEYSYCHNLIKNWQIQLSTFQNIIATWETNNFDENQLSTYIKLASKQISTLPFSRKKSNHTVNFELDDLLQKVIKDFNSWTTHTKIPNTLLTKIKDNAWQNRGGLNYGHAIGGIVGLVVCVGLAITNPPAACGLWSLCMLCGLGAVATSWVGGTVANSYRTDPSNQPEISPENAIDSPENGKTSSGSQFNFGHILGGMIGIVIFLTILAPCLPTTAAEYFMYGLYLAAPIISCSWAGGYLSKICCNENDDDEFANNDDEQASKDVAEDTIDQRQAPDRSPILHSRAAGKKGSSTSFSTGDHKGSLPSLALNPDDQPALSFEFNGQRSQSGLQRLSSFSQLSPPPQGVKSEDNSRTHSRTPSA